MMIMKFLLVFVPLIFLKKNLATEHSCANDGVNVFVNSSLVLCNVDYNSVVLESDLHTVSLKYVEFDLVMIKDMCVLY